ncbi:RRP15-like protein [Aricia agestis]|uniref:RRP15-like protein n=1 Tax=Aricia agestis TaxID=91739 RepID=UPI001C20ADC8|nr:RRP15-like protein [Aricia agestis]
MAISQNTSKVSVKVSVSDTESSEDAGDSEYESENSGEDENSDVEGTAGSSSDGDEDVLMKNEGWADSITKILGSSKPKNKKTLVLSRAKKYADTIKKEKVETPTFEVIGEDAVKEEVKETKTEATKEEPPAKKKKKERSAIRIKPNILEKDRERLLSKIATKGVVQLFNAVRNQQKTFEKELSKDIPEAKKEKVLKTFDKRAFLDTLMGQTKSVLVDEATKSLKDEVKAEDKPRWSALRDDFMMGAKMKDWDKESVDE